LLSDIFICLDIFIYFYNIPKSIPSSSIGCSTNVSEIGSTSFFKKGKSIILPVKAKIPFALAIKMASEPS